MAAIFFVVTYLQLVSACCLLMLLQLEQRENVYIGKYIFIATPLATITPMNSLTSFLAICSPQPLPQCSGTIEQSLFRWI